jgi:hypothetical protein
MAFREGEFILTKDDKNATDWYCAEVSQVLPDRIKVNYYTTVAAPLEDYSTQTQSAKTKRLNDTSFLRTWCLRADGRKPTTLPPTGNRLIEDVYSGKIPLSETNQHVLARDVRLNAHGTLDAPSLRLAANLPLPHHMGAGGPDDYI